MAKQRTSPIIGLSGYGRSGKDTAAQALVDDGWVRVAFGDIIRTFTYAADPWVPVRPTERVNLARLAGKPVNLWTHIRAFIPPWTTWHRISDLVDTYGWEPVKLSIPEARRLLQRIGTEGGRHVIGQDVWVRAVMDNLPDEPVIVSDLRLPLEADAVRGHGGLVVRVSRPGAGPVNCHSSETALDGYPFDAEIINDGTLEQLHANIRAIAARS